MARCMPLSAQPHPTIVHQIASQRVLHPALPFDRAHSLMTELLRKAFEEASKLPPREQDALASELLQELQDEHLWDSTLAASQDSLAALADAALADHHAGKTEHLDPDEL